MLPCRIIIDLFLNKQPAALIIQILFCYKTTCFGQTLCPSSGPFSSRVRMEKRTPDDGQRRCLKNVEFYNRIKSG
jgi:hypothetical protein